MIVLDASAVVAILLNETGFEQLTARLIADSDRCISPMSLVEAVMALARRYTDPMPAIDAFMQRYQVVLSTVDSVQANLAVKAFLTYGKGRHPARLNLGDCFTYAAAKALNAPLLYIGRDFSHTDIVAA